jgi:inorganic pyrophosphatase
MPTDTLKPGTKPPDEINVVVEIPRGSKIKYEIDPKSATHDGSDKNAVQSIISEASGIDVSVNCCNNYM